MKELKLIGLNLENFKGFKSFNMNADGNDVVINAPNGFGKTTIFDAVNWLLFDKDSVGKTLGDSIKTIGADGKVIHQLKHKAEATFSLDGEVFKLGKTFKEKWVNKKGSTEPTFEGHTTSYSIDGKSVIQKTYNEYISGIVSEDVFKILTSPTYFNENLDNKERRRLLFDVFGEYVTDEDIIKLDESFAFIKKIKETNFNKVISETVKEKNLLDKELKAIPHEIKGVENAIFKIKKVDNKKLVESIEENQKQKLDLENRISELRNGETVANEKLKLIEVNSEIAELKNCSQTSESKDKQRELLGLKGLLRGLEDELYILKKAVERGLDEIVSIGKKLSDLRNQRENLNNYKADFDDTCNVCGNKISEEKLKEAKEKVNLNVANKLSEISKEGNYLIEKKMELKQTISTTEESITKLEARIEKGEVIVSNMEESIKSNVIDLDNNEAYQILLRKQNNIESAIMKLKEDSEGDLEDLRNKLKTVVEQYEKLIAIKSEQELLKNADSTIKELKVKQKKVASEYALLSQKETLLNEFIRRKAELIEHKVSEQFKNVRFKLFEQQVNGEIKDVCITLYGDNLVPYDGGLNRAKKINAGLEIIKALSKHYGIKVPVFIDNAEAVLKLVDVKSQTIELRVNPVLTFSGASVLFDNEIQVDSHFEIMEDIQVDGKLENIF